MGTLKIVTEEQYPQILNIHWYQEQLCGTYTNTLLKDKVTETLPLGRKAFTTSFTNTLKKLYMQTLN